MPVPYTSAKLELALKSIGQAGRNTQQWFQHEDSLQWEHAQRWCLFSGTISAFAFVVTFESFLGQATTLSAEQIIFFKSIENMLFNLYREDSDEYTVQLCQCLPLMTERREVCDTFDIKEDTYVTMDLILGIIFPRRSHRYQMDWATGFPPSKGFDGIAEYAAMRLAADLMGVETTGSLAGTTAAELGIVQYGGALVALTDFASSYMKEYS
jgi:hypothetical protein